MILGGAEDDVEIWPAEINFIPGTSADGTRKFCVMNVKTPTLGNFNIPFDTALALGTIHNFAAWMEHVAGSQAGDDE